ncbi:hypothetical protein V494_01006 [Pseudogymnoascus sp. VKM F-4513 (FW-928)]|nr:hypothetical protein V494_01006 [Pseudogymnoascus sp. VKM F-4513 (FW-928)]
MHATARPRPRPRPETLTTPPPHHYATAPPPHLQRARLAGAIPPALAYTPHAPPSQSTPSPLHGGVGAVAAVK